MPPGSVFFLFPGEGSVPHPGLVLSSMILWSGGGNHLGGEPVGLGASLHVVSWAGDL